MHLQYNILPPRPRISTVLRIALDWEMPLPPLMDSISPPARSSAPHLPLISQTILGGFLFDLIEFGPKLVWVDFCLI